MAKKNFKGGLDSLIENSLGIRKSGKKGEMKGNPIDFPSDQNDDAQPQRSDFFFKSSEKEVESKKMPAEENKPAEQPDIKPQTQDSDTQKSDIQTNENIESESQKSEPAKTESKVPSESKDNVIKQPESQEPVIKDSDIQETEDKDSNNQETEIKDSDIQETEDTAQPDSKQEVAADLVSKPNTVNKKAYEPEKIIKKPTIEVEANDNEKNVFLKKLVADLRKELYLWRNGKINVHSFNATLHTHGLKYNPDNNEIEEI